MKQIIATLLFAMAVLASQAQGNLQFSRVLNYTISTPLAAGNSRPTETLVITVPAGKVLKIESAHLSYQTSSLTSYHIANTSNTTGHLVLNGGIIACFDSEVTLNPSTPIWLSAGTHTFVLQGLFNSSSSFRWNAFVSAIEFNVVP